MSTSARPPWVTCPRCRGYGDVGPQIEPGLFLDRDVERCPLCRGTRQVFAAEADTYRAHKQHQEDLQGGLRSRLQALDVVDRDGFQGEKRVLTEALRELERLDRLFATDHGSSAGDSVKSTGG
jgi:hypothetical protein